MTDTAAPPKLSLPPPYTQLWVPQGDILAEAVARAPEHGAGTLVWRNRGGVAAFAVVLEPDRALLEARMAFFAGMAALADALAAHCPPERSVRILYPDTVLYDRSRLGGARFAVAPGAGAGDVPDWLVFAVELIADRDHLIDPGAFPESLSLQEDDFDPAEAIIESFASYLMLYFDRWTHQGLPAVTDRYLERIDPPMLSGSRTLEDGDLVERTPSGMTRRVPLDEGLARCAWRDDRGPRL